MIKRLGSKEFNLSNLPWSDPWIDNKTNSNLPYFCNPKVLPALMSFLNKNVTLVKNDNGLYSVEKTLAELRNKITNEGVSFSDGTEITPVVMGNILAMLRHTNRGEILPGPGQTDPKYIRFAANVPLFMSAFKEYRNVRYSSWDLEDSKLSVVTDHNLLLLFGYVGSEVDWTNEELLAFSEEARTHIGGKNPGSMVKTTAYTFKTIHSDPSFHELPLFVKQLLCQHWVFNPQFPNSYGITNLQDIDAIAVPLITTELFDKPIKPKAIIGELDW